MQLPSRLAREGSCMVLIQIDSAALRESLGVGEYVTCLLVCQTI